MENTEKLNFQTEVKQLLHLMIHSLYSNKEIFLRELVSNASDAIDKLRFDSVTKNININEGKIRIYIDKYARTLSIEDNGIGMNRGEVISHLGTIAKSGTAEFLANMSGDARKDSQLIGQFGVGFYSAFIVAKKVEVFTRSAFVDENHGVYWASEGEGEFEIKDIELENAGTKVVLYLKDNEDEFLEEFRIKNIIKKYSDHISTPIQMEHKHTDDEQVDHEDHWDTINDARALWTIPKAQLKDEDYKEFYKHVAHDWTDPLVWTHNKVEGKLEYTSLLYIPAKAPFDLYQQNGVRGLKLYVQRVFIMDDAKNFLPMYLRFIKGIIDSNDLSLNVSREILQKDAIVESMKTALTKRSLDLIENLSENNEKYQEFYKAFGSVLKEGVAEDFTNKDKIAALLRFSSTKEETESISFKMYLERKAEKQDKIYYLIGESYSALINNPALEIFKKKDIEVILMSSHIDEWMTGYLHEFGGISLVNIGRSDVDLSAFKEHKSDDDKSTPEVSADTEQLIERFKSAIGDKVEKIQESQRLVDSPAILVLANGAMGDAMRQIMAASGQNMPEDKPVFEFNATHPLIQKLDNTQDKEKFKELAEIIFDQATLASGKTLKDPGGFVYKLNKLLLELSN